MGLAEFKRFIEDNNGGYYIDGMSTMFDNVEIYGGRRAVAFSSPVSTVVLYGIIHIDIVHKDEQSNIFKITCKSSRGNIYVESVLWKRNQT